MIAFVPLDDRPCCCQFVERLAAMAGVALITPPPELLGCFLTPGRPAALRDWYREHAPACDLAIVSLDMLAFGGLVASRHPGRSLEHAVGELDAFLSLNGPPVLAFQSILRTAPTQSTPEDVEWATMLLAYAQTGAPELPQDRLAAYLAVRERNHRLNRWSIERVAEGRLAGLLLGIDDSKTRGWNVDEIGRLEPVAEGLPVWITPGTDESAQLLLIRAVGGERQLQVAWSETALTDTVTAYEDRPLGALVSAQLAAAGLEAVDSHARQLLIHGRLGPQAEARDQLPHPVGPDLLDRITARTVLADVAYANGGDLSLVEALRGRELLGYSGWNTAGNTIGTALACLCLGHDAAASRRFLAERIGDDGLYQARHRQRIQAQLGHSGLTLNGAELARAHGYLEGPFLDDWRRFCEPLGLGRSVHVSLPWRRLFEVSLEIG